MTVASSDGAATDFRLLAPVEVAPARFGKGAATVRIVSKLDGALPQE